jgi:O-antigen/teichoic acid export membrane protein
MSRLKNFSRNLATSYLQLGVNVVYSLASVPLILHWLPRTEFGMWATLTQLLGYVSLIDLGMTSAVARVLVDYKDRRSEGGYGSLVKTSFLVSLTQGVIILATVTLGAPVLAELMKIPDAYQATFIALLRWQGLLTACSFSLRPFGLMLYAHQRMDLQACSEMCSLMAQLGLLLLFLMKGCGIYSFIYASAATVWFGPAFLFWNCRRLKLLPQAGEWGPASWNIFKDVFSYGKDVFLMTLGYQLQMASQTIVVSRSFGLAQAATWSVGSKMFSLLVPLMCRPYGAALPGLFEMNTRHERERLTERYRTMVLLTASLGAFLGVALILCNSFFVQTWTAGKISWSPVNDLLLGGWLFVLSMQTTHCNFVTVTKQIGGMRYYLFLEGLSFIVVTSWFSGRWGIPGMLATSILCTLAFTYQYSMRRSRDFFQLPLKVLMVDWVRPSLNLALVFGAVAGATWFCTTGLTSLWRLAIHATVTGTVGVWLLLRLGLRPGMIQEASMRLPRPAGRLLQWLVPGKTMP